MGSMHLLADEREDAAASHDQSWAAFVDLESSDIARRLGDGSARHTFVEPCWAESFGRDGVPMTEEFAAWICDTQPHPVAAFADLLGQPLGRHHRLIVAFSHAYAEWMAARADLEDAL